LGSDGMGDEEQFLLDTDGSGTRPGVCGLKPQALGEKYSKRVPDDVGCQKVPLAPWGSMTSFSRTRLGSKEIQGVNVVQQGLETVGT